MKPRLLDLFCGAGGCTKGYQDAGFHVTGVDIEPMPNYCGDDFIQGDALEVLRGLTEWPVSAFRMSFNAIHASPPCQAFSASTPADKRDGHPDLIAPTRALLEKIGLPYVIENVVGAPLINPTMLCGSSFGLDVRRHRLFETNFPLMAPGCAHGQQADRFDVYEHGKWRKSPTVPVYGSGGRKAVEHWASAMGISWMTRAELAQAIPPAMTEHIGTYLMKHLQTQEVAACSLCGMEPTPAGEARPARRRVSRLLPPPPTNPYRGGRGAVLKLEATIYCDGPECDHSAHLGPDRFNFTGKLKSLPPGFVRLLEYDAEGEHSNIFCGYDCLLKWAAKFPPAERIEP